MTTILKNIVVPTGNILIVQGEMVENWNVSQLATMENMPILKLIFLDYPMKLTV